MAEQTLTKSDIEKQIKPLSDNGFLRFFQKIGRWWLSTWYSFAEKHEKLASLIYKIFFFIVFSEGVTIFQWLVYTYLPYAFGQKMAENPWMWPGIEMPWGAKWTIIGYDVVKNKAGEIIIGGGLGYTLSFWIGSFLAQCINLPLQRNITYRSHGNPWYQAMWYFIGWVLITFATSAINSLWLPIAAKYLPMPVYQILNTVAVGGISMAIFFFIFMVIFPDNAAAAKRAKAKLDKLVAEKADDAQIKAATAVYEKAAKEAEKTKTDKDLAQASSIAGAKSMKYIALSEELQKNAEDKELAIKVEECYNEAIAAIETKEKAAAAKEVAWAE